MGFYVNPVGEGKISWLRENAKPCQRLPKWEDIPKDSAVLCLVDNGAFHACGIAYSKRELEAWGNNPDGRQKLFYIAQKKDIIKASNISMENFE